MFRLFAHGVSIKLKFALVLIVLLTVVFVSGARSQSIIERFNKGDGLRLTIWQPWTSSDVKNQINVNGNYIIDSRGYIFLPLIGEVKVTSHNTKTLAEELKNSYSAYIQDPIVVVEPLIRVALLGEFIRPGTYLISQNASLWELVALAEGPNENANMKKMYLERSGKIIKKNLLGGFERAYTLSELGAQSGDQILLAEKKPFELEDAFRILQFILSLLNLYFIVDRL